MNDILEGKRLLLASNSPRRHELMTAMGLKFDAVAKYAVDEIYPNGMDAVLVPAYLARLKSDAYPHPIAAGEILITADTVVVCEGAILGKPRDRDEATGMLKRLSGRTHRVLTAVCLREGEHRREFTADTRVTFRELAAWEIEQYVDSRAPMDKAGAYGIQEWIGLVGVRGIEGSYTNVVGLPTEALWMELREFLMER